MMFCRINDQGIISLSVMIIVVYNMVDLFCTLLLQNKCRNNLRITQMGADKVSEQKSAKIFTSCGLRVIMYKDRILKWI